MKTARVFCFVVCCAALMGVATLFGLPQRLYAADTTGLTIAIAGLFVVAPFIGSEWRRWLSEQGVPLLLGLFGTIVGFWITLDGAISGDQELKMDGLGTALSTTIAGLVAHFYIILLGKIGDE